MAHLVCSQFLKDLVLVSSEFPESTMVYNVSKILLPGYVIRLSRFSYTYLYI